MTKYIVTGGTKLQGQVKIHGAKNAGFKEMIAALLADSPSQIKNFSRIGEIGITKEVIERLGGKVTEKGERELEIDPKSLASFDAPKSCGGKSRAGMMFVGPLLAQFGQAILPVPGGDKIGVRPIDRHLAGLEALGAKIELRDGIFYISAPNGLTGARYRFRKNTHTGTETLLLAAVKAKGITILENAAAEPEVDDLIAFLNAAGAKIRRLDERTIEITGVDSLHGASHEVIADRNAAVTFACAAVATRGDIFVEGADEKVLTAFLEKLDKAGGGLETQKKGIRFFWRGELLATNVTAVPYPGFMTDWQPLWTLLMTQAKGNSTIIETIHNFRFGHVPLLTEMGAKIEMFNPIVSDPDSFYNFNLEDDLPENWHAVKIFGSTRLSGCEVTVDDVRMGATMILAGLTASGKTTIIDPKDQVTRGYENLAQNLVSLGANIEIVKAKEEAYTKTAIAPVAPVIA